MYTQKTIRMFGIGLLIIGIVSLYYPFNPDSSGLYQKKYNEMVTVMLNK